MKKIWLISLALLMMAVFVNCSDDSSGGSGSGSGGDGDTDADIVGNADGDTDIDADSDADAGGDADSDSDSETGFDSDTGTETGADDDTESDSGDICEVVNVAAEPLPPRVVILQDLSSSLDSYNRWDTLKAAMVQVVDAYDTQFALGLVPFATTILDGGTSDADCTVNRDHVIAPAPGNSTVIKNKVYNIDSNDLIGGTPTNEGLVAGRELLVDQDPGDGSDRVVILVTDGAPNCLDGDGGDGSTTADQDRVTATITGLHDSDSIDIYVVGYDLSSSYTALMNLWAKKGGTSAYYPADDTTGLMAQMDSIASELIPCEYTVENEIADPELVLVKIDESGRPFNDPDGWTLGADKKTITLTGGSCDMLRDGGSHDLNITVECEKVVIILQ